MKKQKIKLQDGSVFEFLEMVLPAVQEKLARAYKLQKDFGRVKCLCSDKDDLELVVAYRRKSDQFELRKMPGQLSSLHSQDCFLNRKKKQSESSNPKLSRNDFLIGFPSKENGFVSDHERLDFFLEVMLDESEKVPQGFWSKFKRSVLENAESKTVNGEPLLSVLNVLRPSPKDRAKPIWFKEDEARIIIGELLYSNFTKTDKSLLLKIKGTNDVVWFNWPKIPDSTLALLESGGESQKVFIACTVVKSKAGTVSGFGLAARKD